jgi:DNA-binding transcriptional MerR regulator
LEFRVVTSPNKPSKSQYTEAEAAQHLGISVEQLRVLVQRHIVTPEDEPGAMVSSFQPSDLVLLRVLAQAHLVSERTR